MDMQEKIAGNLIDPLPAAKPVIGLVLQAFLTILRELIWFNLHQSFLVDNS
jgi:hypothetical protein